MVPQTLSINKSKMADNAMVVSAHPLASKIGVDIMKQGGNAVDAAIAIQFALAVCYPVAGNIGGGGFMVYRGADGETSTLDYREKAPAAAFADMYLDKDGKALTDLSQFGHLASGVPGSVDGMWEAFNKYSKLKDWKVLIQPSIDAAKYGVILTEREARGLNSNTPDFDKVNKGKTVFTSKVWKAGDILKQPDLAKTLIAIRDKGRDGFYKGKVADQIVAEMKSGNGIITHEDLANYNSVWRKPLMTSYRGHDIITMPLPSSGGVVLAQLLQAIEPYNMKDIGFHSPFHVHLFAEAERRSYADRSKHMGDADFYPVPVDKLISPEYVYNRMTSFNYEIATPSDQIEAGKVKESDQTTHFNIVDSEGNAVSITTTLNGGYGSNLVIKNAGFLMNNEMDDFSIKPGVPNLYGLIGAEANKIEPGKRMLSSMTPAIVLKNKKPYIVIGTPGGSTIITSVFQGIVNIIDFDMDAAAAVAAPRFHHQWKPDMIYIEKDALSKETQDALTKMGHKLMGRDKIGRLEAIVIDKNGKKLGGADPRGDDDANGY
jgi:gamma-glutamyltranspeptidase/glutathione hydrolase